MLSEVRLTEELRELTCCHQTQSASNMNPCLSKITYYYTSWTTKILLKPLICMCQCMDYYISVWIIT